MSERPDTDRPTTAEQESSDPPWSELLDELVAVCADILERRGVVKPAQSQREAEAIVLGIADHIGGSRLYIPNGERVRTALKGAEIWREYTGRNARSLARRYGLSESRIYQILAHQRMRFAPGARKKRGAKRAE